MIYFYEWSLGKSWRCRAPDEFEFIIFPLTIELPAARWENRFGWKSHYSTIEKSRKLLVWCECNFLGIQCEIFLGRWWWWWQCLPSRCGNMKSSSDDCKHSWWLFLLRGWTVDPSHYPFHRVCSACYTHHVHRAISLSPCTPRESKCRVSRQAQVSTTDDGIMKADRELSSGRSDDVKVDEKEITHFGLEVETEKKEI